jgi:DNA-binding GntR family transcriptional regulator
MYPQAMAVEPLQIESVVDRVYAVLRRRILDGELARGTRLRQEALAAELGVSRTPLREALRRLAAEGLVAFHPNRGAQVVDMTAEDVRRAYEARIVVEPGAARLAASRRPAAGLRAMREAIDAERRSVDRAGAYNASRAFHLALVRASENEHLMRMAEALWVPGIAQGIFERQAADADLVSTDLAEHERIVRAVESGDGELAEALARRHIAGAHARILDVVE